MQKLLDATGFIVKIFMFEDSRASANLNKNLCMEGHRVRFLNQLEKSGQRTHGNMLLVASKCCSSLCHNH